MIYRVLFLVSLFVFVSLSVVNVVVLSQSQTTRQVGVPICEIYTEQSGV